MTVSDAARAALEAWERVCLELELGAKREGSPEGLAVALVALQSSMGVLRTELERPSVLKEGLRPRRVSARYPSFQPCSECNEPLPFQHALGCTLARPGDAIVRGPSAWHK